MGLGCTSSFPKLDSLPCELEESFLDSPVGQYYFVILNIETQRLRSSEIPLKVQGLVLLPYSCVTPRMKSLRLWLVG